MSKTEKILLAINILLYGFVAIFSYSYVDLNLTISQNKLILSFVDTIQQLGYFNRPQATLIYLLLIIFTFSFFIFNLWLFYKSKIGLNYLQFSTLASTLILVFAYPFLSYDLFNYMFDAKIILNYHANPYTHRPLDFPQDDWLRFMRWVHRYSPYGPFWLGMSIIPAFLGFGKFILNYLTFKIFISSFHLINTYIIYKVLLKTNPKNSIFWTATYAFNPLFLLEGVANAHNDIVLATFLILPIYFLISKKITWSYITLFTGALIKYIPVLNLPPLIFCHFKDMNRHNFRRLIFLNLATMAVFTYLFSSFNITVPFVSSGATQTQFQPWYLFWTLPLVAVASSIELIILGTAVSLGSAIRYLTYLFTGEWTHPGTLLFMKSSVDASIAIGILAVVARKFIFK